MAWAAQLLHSRLHIIISSRLDAFYQFDSRANYHHHAVVSTMPIPPNLLLTPAVLLGEKISRHKTSLHFSLLAAIYDNLYAAMP